MLLTGDTTSAVTAVTQALVDQISGIQAEYAAACALIIVPAISIWAGPKILRYVKKFFNAASAN